MEDFILYAYIGGVGIAILSSLIGSFVIWKKMSYFGDSLSHSVLLGVIISIFLQISPMVGAFIMAIIFALSLHKLKKYHESDTILGILAHSGMALAIIAVSLIDTIKIDIMSYLFGDILAISQNDIYIIYAISIFVLVWLKFNWQKMLLNCINKELAIAEKINVKNLNLQFTLLIAAIVVVSLKFVGGLLITALLILPSSTARNFSNSPLQMLVLSTFFGVISVILGIYTSIIINTPSGPTIILSNLLFFCISITHRNFSK